MKTSSRRIKENVESDVKVIKGLTIFNFVFILVIIGLSVLAIVILVNFFVEKFNQLQALIP